MLTRKLHLSTLPFKRLFSNHLNRDTEARCRDSSIFLVERYYGDLSSAKFAMSISLCIRNKPTKKILNKSGPKIEPCGTTSITTSQSLYELMTLVLCF